MGVTVRRLAASAVLGGGILAAIGLLGLWILLPPVGAALTILAGAGLAGAGWRALVRST